MEKQNTIKHEDSDSYFTDESFDKETLVMQVKGKPTCEVCNQQVHETWGVEAEGFRIVELCIICFSHRYGTQNAVDLQRVSDKKRGKSC